MLTLHTTWTDLICNCDVAVCSYTVTNHNVLRSYVMSIDVNTSYTSIRILITMRNENEKRFGATERT